MNTPRATRVRAKQRRPRPPAAPVAVFAAVLVIGLFYVSPHAHSFFPIGGFQSTNNNFVFLKWAFEAIDRNGDGEVFGGDSADGDGVPITIETGDDGFTNDEVAVIMDSFDVWENLPGSFIAFSFTGTTDDNLVFGSADGIFGFFLTTPNDDLQPGLDEGTLGLTSLQFFIDDQPLGFLDTFPDVFFPIRGGEIFDADIVIGSGAFRPEDTDPDGPPPLPGALKGVSVHEIGHFIGLDHTPMNNLSIVFDAEDNPIALEEDAVIPIRDGSGVLRIVGVTPTMFPISFQTNADGSVSDGAQTLAHDDISAAVTVYPRTGNLDDFFTLAQEARTNAREGVPSFPFVGGHVIAWADHDNNPQTSRLPLISTMSGLYTNSIGEASLDIDGRFRNIGMPKQLETSDAILFNPTYVMTLDTLQGEDLFGLLPGAPVFDSTHGNNPDFDDREDDEYTTLRLSEVFSEDGNIIDSDNREQGTPLFFDPVRRQIVSANSGKTLAQMLPSPFPMFGDAQFENVCPLNVVAGGDIVDGDVGDTQNPFSSRTGTASINPLTSLRGFRDNVLMRSAPGRTLTDAYYRVAPYASQYLLTNEGALAASRNAYGALAWLFSGGFATWLVGGLVGAIVFVLVRRKRAALTAGLVVLMLAPSAEGAQWQIQSADDVVAKSHDVVHGRVIAKDSFYEQDKKRILTDVIIEVEDVMKGSLNKSSHIHLQLLGGRVGGHVHYVTGLADFREGEEVVLFLKFQKSNGFVVTQGASGKFNVVTDDETGEKFVKPTSPAGKVYLNDASKAVRAKSDESSSNEKADRQPAKPGTGMKLDQFKDFIRDTANKQARKQG